MNHEIPDVQPGFRKGRGTRDQIANIHWITEKTREFQKNIYFCFTILWWFLPYIHMNQPWMNMCSPSWTLLPPPSSSHPSGSSQCTSPGHPVSCINLDWWSISHMIVYMFQCSSLKSSHPRLLPPSPKVYSLHLCLFCCLTYRVIVTIFLNSIYMR